MKKYVSAAVSFALAFALPVAAGATEKVHAESAAYKLNWRHGVFYEIYVRSFYDSNKDGDGDLRGIMQKMNYLNDNNPYTKRDLNINGLWLMPITKSPSYHKYDVTDYYQVDPQYGTLKDFRAMVKKAHQHGVKVIMDLVVNHTSNQHPWFQSAMKDKNSPYRDYYIWADKNTDIHEKGPWGQPVWHETYPGSGDYYYGLFWSGMPDLNYDNPKVREEIKKVGKFWLKQGADGFRLDAAKHIYDEKDVDKNLQWWNEFKTAMKQEKPDVYLVSEVWSNFTQVAPYYRELDTMFNFDLADKILQSAKSESDQGIASFSETTYKAFKEANPDAIDAPFLTNHDQNRTMSVLEGDKEQAKVAASILLTLPGNPFIYYGEEIGMLGEKPDEYIREPFRWYPGSGKGQTTWEEPRHNKGPDAVSVEAQNQDPNSLLNHYRNMIHLRQEHPALMKGDIQAIDTGDDRIVAFQRTYGKETLIVVHNLSGETVQLDQFGKKKRVHTTSKQVKTVADGKLHLPGYSSVILEK
ncbi:alpha-amylase [Marinithermofilum abyssi]|uniref:Alpha-amylase n=1 Tax=Marinithermofilum abyssi TaxID=1571185 RepID=A0A8J2VGH7_9BACL|nr:alpha-amylase family glycosyl hydrolase [Marinithermofilum abyssi]GGE20966.1 alpha-amylase [Marinithermofilum abyssi]